MCVCALGARECRGRGKEEEEEEEERCVCVCVSVNCEPWCTQRFCFCSIVIWREGERRRALRDVRRIKTLLSLRDK